MTPQLKDKGKYKILALANILPIAATPLAFNAIFDPNITTMLLLLGALVTICNLIAIPTLLFSSTDKSTRIFGVAGLIFSIGYLCLVGYGIFAFTFLI